MLVNLKGTLATLGAVWAGSAEELTLVEGLCTGYKTALDTRDAAWQSARNLRVARNVAKEAFLAGYLEISFKVKALYPKDKKMQDLFFDEVENEVEKDLGDEPEAASPAAGGTPPTGAPPAGTTTPA